MIMTTEPHLPMTAPGEEEPIRDEVRVGIIGAGFIADYHLEALTALQVASTRAIAARSTDRARALAAVYGIPSVEANWRALLSRADIAAVVIATPDDTHCEIACAALESGKAVLLQKPMARTGAEARTILAAARRSGAPLEVSFMHRHLPEVVRTARSCGRADVARCSRRGCAMQPQALTGQSGSIRATRWEGASSCSSVFTALISFCIFSGRSRVFWP